MSTRNALSPNDCFLASLALGDESCLSDSSGNDEAWSTSSESPRRSVQSTRLSSSFEARTSQRSETTCHAWPGTGGRGGCAKGCLAVPERTESMFFCRGDGVGELVQWRAAFFVEAVRARWSYEQYFLRWALLIDV